LKDYIERLIDGHVRGALGMELFQIRYFVTAARLLSFSRAAEALFVSQPALSQQIGKLEGEVGAPLFRRQGRLLTLTDAGEALLPVAERMLEGEDEARQVVRRVAGLDQGRLTLYALPALDQHLLPPWLAAFRRAHPGIELRVRELRPAGTVAAAVRAGAADLGFIHLPCDTSGLEVRELLEDPFSLAIPDRPGKRARDTVRLADMAEAEWVWVHDAKTADHPLYAACLDAGFVPRIVCESGSAQGVLALVAAGLGIALLPELAIELRDGVRVIPLAEPRPSRTLAVIWDAERLSHAGRAFLEMCSPAPGVRDT
jgi:DNA-binding transcriptional LysR family regulator